MEVHLDTAPLHVERLRTIKEAASALGLQEWKLHRAVKAGLIPAYHLFNWPAAGSVDTRLS